MASHYPGIIMTGHIGTNAPKFVPPRWGRLPFDPTQTGLRKFGRGFGARNISGTRNNLSAIVHGPLTIAGSSLGVPAEEACDARRG